MGRSDEHAFATLDSFDALEGAIDSFCQGLGIQFFSYLRLKGRADIAAPLLTNYDREWRSRYAERSYQHYDPVAVTSQNARLPFFWNHGRFLTPFVKLQKRVFHEARAFQISAGYSIPVAGPHGDVAVFSLADPDERHLVDVVRSEGAALVMTALQAHDAAMCLTEQHPHPSDGPTLSDRELECLKWTADGKTSLEISELMALSPATVNYHLNKAVLKLNAANRHHAAIIAIRKNLML